jgi:hypothetical protein
MILRRSLPISLHVLPHLVESDELSHQQVGMHCSVSLDIAMIIEYSGGEAVVTEELFRIGLLVRIWRFQINHSIQYLINDLCYATYHCHPRHHHHRHHRPRHRYPNRNILIR